MRRRALPAKRLASSRGPHQPCLADEFFAPPCSVFMCFGRAIATKVSPNDNRPGSKTRAMCLMSLVWLGARGGDGGNRTRVRDRAKDGVYERSRRSMSRPPLANAGGVAGDQPRRCPPSG